MAGLDTPNPRPQASKQMSSRLLNMKFMQRAAASTPTSQTAQTPSTTGPAAKRRRIESTTSSPSVSTPGTPAYAGTKSASQTAYIPSREGTNTFSRSEGADTEWILDLKLKLPDQGNICSRGNGISGLSGIPGLGEVEDDPEDDQSDADGNIWHDQPSGRQTFGSFKAKRKTRRSTSASNQHDQDMDDNQDLSSAPSDESDADSNASDRSSLEDRRTSRSRHSLRKKVSKDIDSDEEMRRVRLAMEQKHDRMTGSGASGGFKAKASLSDLRRMGAGHAGGGSVRGGGKGGGPGKRRREEQNFQAKKKARKTI